MSTQQIPDHDRIAVDESYRAGLRAGYLAVSMTMATLEKWKQSSDRERWQALGQFVRTASGTN